MSIPARLQYCHLFQAMPRAAQHLGKLLVGGELGSLRPEFRTASHGTELSHPEKFQTLVWRDLVLTYPWFPCSAPAINTTASLGAARQIVTNHLSTCFEPGTKIIAC